VCDKIVSTDAQHAHAIIFKNYSKYQIKTQILTKNKKKLEKRSMNPSNRTKVKILEKKICFIGHQKNSKFFFFNLPRAYKVLIEVKKSKLSHACVPLRPRTNHTCHQKTNPYGETVLLTTIGNNMMAEIRSLLSE